MLDGVQENGGLPGWPKAVRDSQIGWIGKEEGKLVAGNMGSIGTEIFINNEDLKHLRSAKFVAINCELKKEAVRQFLSVEQFKEFETYLT